MPYIIKAQSARWVDPAEGYVLQAGESFADTPPEYVAPAPSKVQRIAALLAPYKLERISIQMVIGMAEMRADLTALQTSGATTREADLANSFTKNTAYRVARTLENACLAIEAGA